MKKLLSWIALSTLLALPACDRNKPITGKFKDGLNDALDRRPGEKVRDTVEDTTDAVKDAGEEIEDAVKDSSK